MAVPQDDGRIYFMVEPPNISSPIRHEWDIGLGVIVAGLHYLFEGKHKVTPLSDDRQEIRVITELKNVEVCNRLGTWVDPENLETRLTSVSPSLVALTVHLNYERRFSPRSGREKFILFELVTRKIHWLGTGWGRDGGDSVSLSYAGVTWVMETDHEGDDN